jgi:hypothetical protein
MGSLGKEAVMKTITPEGLRQLTQEAIESGIRRREAEVRIATEKEKAKLLEEQLRARGIIAQIPGRAETEALAGRNHAIVMGLKYNEDFTYDAEERGYDQKNCYRTLNPAKISSTARLVFDHCEAAGLKPSFEFWHDGAGVNSGWNIVIHW